LNETSFFSHQQIAKEYNVWNAEKWGLSSWNCINFVTSKHISSKLGGIMYQGVQTSEGSVFCL